MRANRDPLMMLFYQMKATVNQRWKIINKNICHHLIYSFIVIIDHVCLEVGRVVTQLLAICCLTNPVFN